MECYEEGSVASELLDSYAEGNEDGEEDLHVPLGRFGGLRVDRGMTVAHTAGRLREPGLLGRRGRYDDERKEFVICTFVSVDEGAETVRNQRF